MSRTLSATLGPIALVLILALLPALIIVSPAAGQETPVEPELPPPPPRVAVDLMTGVWIPRLDGNVTFGPAPVDGHIRLKEQLDVNDLEVAVNVELTLRLDDRWQIRAGGFEFSTEGSTTINQTESFGVLTLNPADRLETSVDLRSYSIEAGREFYRPVPNQRRGERAPTTLRVAAKAGVRYLDVDQDIDIVGGGRDSAAGDWVAIYAGVDLELRYAPVGGLPWGRAFAFEVGAAVGSAIPDGGLLVQLRSGLSFDLTANLGLMFGYRLLEVDFDDGDYEFDAGLQGLFIAGTLKF